MQYINKFSDRVLELSRTSKRVIAVTVDVLLCLLTVALAYRLRLDEWIFPIGSQWLSYIVAVAIAIPIFVRLGLYRAIFRYVGWHALGIVTWGCALYGMLYALLFTAIGVPLVPRSTGILQPILLFLAVGASRALIRYLLGGGYAAARGRKPRRRVLIYGAGSAGRQLAAGLANSVEMQVVGFVDDNRTLHGNYMNGKRIFAPEHMGALIEELGIADVLLAIPSATRTRRGEIVGSLSGHRVSVRTLPGIFDLADGRVTVNDLRPLEIEDLLGRDVVPPDDELMGKCISGKTVLVTGAGGSIGSELCRQILGQHPSKIMLIDNSEYNLYAIDYELRQHNADKGYGIEIQAFLASVQDQPRIEHLIAEHKPHTIYHAAAYKHVPIVQSNACEGIKNNVLGTEILTRIAERHQVEDFVLISTDKAVRPTNIMGATKRVAEMVLQSTAQNGSATRFSMVRFGNVLGSSGSVVPLFRQQIAAGGPVTVTHPEVTRYFMTIPEAAQLVIQAGAMAEGGDVFVLDMGEPIRIADLARRMIELSGLTVRNEESDKGDIDIVFTGLRPGEKMYEELLIGNNPSRTSHRLIMKAHEHCPAQSELAVALRQLSELAASHQDAKLLSVLAQLVPEVDNSIDRSSAF